MTCILPKSEQGLSEEIKQSKAMFTLYQITLRPTQKPYRIGLLFTCDDIDIAHRVPSRRRNQDNKPNPIVCKFVRRLSKEGVMRLRKEAIKVNPSVRIFDHLTPKNQKILYEAKAFKEANSYEYCWTKNSRVYLRKNATSRAIRINRLEDLHSLRE